MFSGAFFVFEGIEGSGKTTQAQLLYQALLEKGVKTILTQEPGGTDIGNKIREILLDPKNSKMHVKTELLLYLASRAQHIYEKILPELRLGTVIISDRFALSSLAYQGIGRELSLKVVSRLNRFATANLKPDLTIVTDVPVEIGLARTRKKTLDRLEQEEVKFHSMIREGYLKLAKRAPKKIRVFDGRKDVQFLHQEIKGLVFKFLKEKGVK